MQSFSKDEAAQWLEKLNISLSDTSWKQRYRDRLISFAIPADTGKRTALARLLAEVAANGSESLLWITGYGIWPSSEIMDLFDGYRKSIGESRSIHEAPFHIFSSQDLKQLECILAVTLYFLWDALVLNHLQGVLIEISHDEIIDISATDYDLLGGLRAQLARCGLEEISRTVR